MGFLDEWTPYLDLPDCPVHEDPFHPITRDGKALVAGHPESEVPIVVAPRRPLRGAPRPRHQVRRPHRGDRSRQGASGGAGLNTEDALAGLIPRMHRELFAMNELPDLDDLVQVGLFNILEERDVQIRGHSLRHRRVRALQREPRHLQPLRQGHPPAQGPHRHHGGHPLPPERELGMQITREQAIEDGILELDDRFPVVVPRFVAEVVEQMAINRASKWVRTGVSARLHRELRDDGLERPATGDPPRRPGEPTPAIPRSATSVTSTAPRSASSSST